MRRKGTCRGEEHSGAAAEAEMEPLNSVELHRADSCAMHLATSFLRTHALAAHAGLLVCLPPGLGCSSSLPHPEDAASLLVHHLLVVLL